VTWKRQTGFLAGGGFEVWIGPGEAVLTLYEEALKPSFYRFRAMSAESAELVRLKAPEKDARPAVALDSSVLWINGDGTRILHDDGSTFADLMGSGGFEYDPLTREAGVTFAEWTSNVFFDTPEGTFGIVRSFLSELRVDGSIDSTIRYDFTARFGSNLGKELRLGNAQFDPKEYPDWNWFPSVFDIPNRVVRPILNPFADRGHSGRNYIRAVQLGPFARVTGTGSCLNIRESPNTTARVRECVADRVLLTYPGTPSSLPPGVSPDGWVEVISPSGTQGWASAQYLER